MSVYVVNQKIVQSLHQVKFWGVLNRVIMRGGGREWR